MSKRCFGCGITLQTIDKTSLGYVPESNYDKGYCMRCFRLTNYRDYKSSLVKLDSKKILNKINKMTGTCFFLCDILNFNEESFNFYKSIKIPKFFVVSKSDIIPKSIRYDRIKSWLRNTFGIKEEIIFASTKHEEGLRKINNFIDNYSDNIYFLGMTNVGKSSLLNSLFCLLDKKLTVSLLPNTTLDFNKITDKVYDTPGLPYSYSLDTNIIKNINVNKEIKPIIMPIKANASLLIRDLVRVTTDRDNYITGYFANTLKIEKVYENNQTLIDDDCLNLNVDDNTNVYLKGIGYFHIKNACALKIYHVSTDMISVMKSF